MNKKNISLERCVEIFLSQYKETTRISYNSTLEDMLGYLGPANHPSDIHAIDVLDYVGKVKSRDYSPATINKYIKTVKVFFNWCVKMELIEASPAANISRVRIPEAIDRNMAMQPDEFDRIIEYFKVAVKYPVGHFRWRNYAVFLFLADTGCRRGGISTLTVDRINTIERVATVTEKGKQRNVYFGDECARAIDNWLDEQKNKGVGSKWVFSTTGNQWKPAAVSQMIRRVAKRAGVRKTRSSHSMRHMFGQRMADQMVNPKLTQHAMGHSDVTITIKNYYDTNEDEIKKTMRKNSYRPPVREKIRIFEDPKKQSS